MKTIIFDRLFDYYGKKKCMGRRIAAFALDIDVVLTDKAGRKEHLVSLTEDGTPSVFAAAVNGAMTCRLDADFEGLIVFETSAAGSAFYEQAGISAEYIPAGYYVVVKEENEQEEDDDTIRLGGTFEDIPVERALFMSLLKDAIKNDEIALTGRCSAYSNR